MIHMNTANKGPSCITLKEESFRLPESANTKEVYLMDGERLSELRKTGGSPSNSWPRHYRYPATQFPPMSGGSTNQTTK